MGEPAGRPLASRSEAGATVFRAEGRLGLRYFLERFFGFFYGVVVGIRRQTWLDLGPDCKCTEFTKRCVLHVSVEVAGEAVGGHNALHGAIVVVDFFFDVAFFVDRVAPSVTLLEGQMSFEIEEEIYRFIFGVDQSDLLGLDVAGQGLPSIEQERHRWILSSRLVIRFRGRICGGGDSRRDLFSRSRAVL